MGKPGKRTVTPRCAFIAAWGLLLLLWGLLAMGGQQLSLSMDEPYHIIGGYIFLACGAGELWYLPHHMHPPLLNVLQAVLIFADRPRIPLESLSGWDDNFVEFTASFLLYLIPLERTEVLARTPVMLITLLLGALIFRWGKDLAGPKAGVFALAIMTFDPLVLAHGRLATTDLGVTAWGTAALYTLWRWAQRPSWKLVPVISGLLSFAVLTKFSGWMWVAAFGVVAISMFILRRRSRGAYLLQTAVIAGFLLFLLWAFFGFRIGVSPLTSFITPIPEYWTAFYNQIISAGQRHFFALGRMWIGPQWWYFPLNFVIRNPLPLLLALPVSVWFILRAQTRRWLLFLALFPALYGGLAIIQGMNVAYRHMLPLHPFLHLLIAWGIAEWLKSAFFRRFIVVGLLGFWYVWGTARLFPDELTYFNELVGGPERAHRYLVDYSQDWGQSMKQLRAYLDAHPGPEPYIVYYTHVRPEYYGIRYRSLAPSPGAREQVTPLYPQPGRYAMGVAPLYGLVGRDPMELEWFRRATPQAIVGHAYYIYEIQQRPQWLFQCSTPTPPLDDSAIVWGFGPLELRRGTFDCTDGWVYPVSGKALGVYAFHGHLLQQPGAFLPPSLRPQPVPADTFIRRHLADTRLAYYQPFFGLLPAFALYEQDPDFPPDHYLLITDARTADGESFQAPISFTGPLTFLGAAAFRDDSGLDVETWWQVTEGPITRPLSIMGHLLNGAGEVIGQDDGLGVSPVVWQPGDIIVQRHRFTPPPAGEELWLRTGVYWLDTMERWKVADLPQADVLLISLKHSPERR